MLPEFRDLPYTSRLSKFGLSSLFARRLHNDLVCVFKILHGYIDVDSSIFFNFHSDPRTRGHRHKIRSFHSRLDIRSYWFSYRVVPHWNNLPNKVVEFPTVKSFKK